MFRRVGTKILNLAQVSYIELWGKTIEYNIASKRWLILFGSGGSDDNLVKEKFEKEEDAEKAFEELSHVLAETKKMK